MTLLKNLDNGVTTPLLGNGYRSSETSLMSAEDDEIASDIDDDVFIKTGRTQHKFVEDEVKKPLMPPRKKTSSKTDTFQTDVVTTKPSSLCLPVCYGIVALIALIGSLGVVSIAVVYLSSLYDAKWNSSNEKIFTKYPWKHIKSSNVWQQSAPQYELGVSQTFDANNDSIVDLVIGFSTVPGSYLENTDNNLICEIYFDGLKTCGGGVRVLDGRKGDPIWVYWTPHPVREVSCGVDLTQDGIKDCVLSDKKENVVCVNGANGAVLWKYHPIQSATSLSFCQLNDVDYDLLPDFLLVINQPPAAMDGNQIVVISGASGDALVTSTIPSGHLVLTSPVLHTGSDGTVSVVLGSQDYDGGGSVLIVPLLELLYQPHPQISTVYRTLVGSISFTPIIYNIDDDGIEDILVITQSDIIAVRGGTFESLWNTSFSEHIIARPPTIGYYDNDNVGDIFVHLCWRSLNSTCRTVSFQLLSGADGSPILSHPHSHSISVPPVSASIRTENTSIFLYWSIKCHDVPLAETKYFLPADIEEGFHDNALICWSLYGKNSTLTLFAFGKDMSPPGEPVFTFNIDSSAQQHLQTSEMGRKYKSDHPELVKTNGEEEDYDSGFYRPSNYGNFPRRPLQDVKPYLQPYEAPLPSRGNYRRFGSRPYKTRKLSVKPKTGRGYYPFNVPDYDRRPRRSPVNDIFVPVLHGLTPVLLPGSADGQDNIDVAVLVSWHYPFENLILTTDDISCLQKSSGNPSISASEKIKNCHARRSINDDRLIVSEEGYLEINMGQTHIFRINLKCQNGDKKYYHALPFFLQEWSQKLNHFYRRSS